MSSADFTHTKVDLNMFAKLDNEFVDVVRNAYATGQSFDEICRQVMTQDDYKIPDTTYVWNILRDDQSLRAAQISRLTSWIEDSPSNCRSFDHIVNNADPEEISEILSAKEVTGQVLVIHPDVVSEFTATGRGKTEDEHPERRVQHWLSTNASYYKTFCEALMREKRCEDVDDCLDLPVGTTYHILKLNPAPRRVFCDSHPGKGATKYLHKPTRFENAVRDGKTYSEIQSSLGMVQQSMSNYWTTIHPSFQSAHVMTYYDGCNQQREKKRYEEGGDRYELLQSLDDPIC